MATYRRDELIRRALRMLDVVSATEAPEAEDAADAEQYLQSMLETLHGDGLIPFDLDGDEIPAPYMLPLAQKLAMPGVSSNACGPTLLRPRAPPASRRNFSSRMPLWKAVGARVKSVTPMAAAATTSLASRPARAGRAMAC